MPLYDYACDNCGNRFELKQGFDADPKQPCPRCERIARRVFHPVGVVYKGTGFYSTDYRKSGPVASEATAAKTDEKPPAKAAAAPSEVSEAGPVSS